MLHWGSIIKSTLQQCYIRAKIDIISLHIFTDYCILPCYEIQEVWCKMCEPRDQQHWRGRSKNVSFQNNRQDGTKMWEKGKILCWSVDWSVGWMLAWKTVGAVDRGMPSQRRSCQKSQSIKYGVWMECLVQIVWNGRQFHHHKKLYQFWRVTPAWGSELSVSQLVLDLSNSSFCFWNSKSKVQFQ